MTQNNVEKRVYTEQETAAYIGMSRSFLRQARMEGPRKTEPSRRPSLRLAERFVTSKKT